MAKRPNVLLVTTDHWPAALLGCAGHPAIQTPTLDALAASGIRFTNAYSECPVCIPARRTLMTGVSPRTHGDRNFGERMPMPELPTLAQTFRDAGYQACAVGKLHVYPQRNRIGFDDVILDEEGRTQYGVTDDYELFLGDSGYTGRQFYHGMSNNRYVSRPWHLPEHTHATNWATAAMIRTIKRRDPTRPAFWYLAYRHPHPPLVPLAAYLELYREQPIDEPRCGSWAEDPERLPLRLRAVRMREAYLATPTQIAAARRAFYALCTHIDHQLSVIVGTLREEALLDDTVICFSSDHGDMLGNHGLWAKQLFYEPSANVPLLLVGADSAQPRVGIGVDERVVGLQDVMPTLLRLAGITVPDSVEGRSALADPPRPWLYGELGEDSFAGRMVHDGRFKLIYYPAGNRTQIFDLRSDPHELTDLGSAAAASEAGAARRRLQRVLLEQLYGDDLAWVREGELVGLPDADYRTGPNKGLSGQRGGHWPPPPRTDMQQVQWLPGSTQPPAPERGIRPGTGSPSAEAG